MTERTCKPNRPRLTRKLFKQMADLISSLSTPLSRLVNRGAMYKLACQVFHSGLLDLWIPEEEVIALAQDNGLLISKCDLVGMLRCCFLDRRQILIGQYGIEHRRKPGKKPISTPQHFYRFNLDGWNLTELQDRLQGFGLKVG